MIDHFSGPRYAFLSNFYPIGIEVEMIQYPSLEHAFQASKTTKHDERMWILRSATPGIAKHRGRRVTLRPYWEETKVAVMRGLLEQKFGDKNPELQRRLLATMPAELIEGNTWRDTFWGVCGGVGHNWLGRLLMEIRADLARNG